MGKKLIIKGADFYENAIQPVEYYDTTLYQGIINTNPGSANYGNITTSGGLSDQFVLVKIFVESGKTLRIYIQDGSTLISDKPNSAVFSTSDIAIQSGNKVTNILASTYPSSTDNVQSDGGYQYTNNTGSDAYMYASWGVVGTTFSASGKVCQYVIL